jgi:hypothetical protein
MGLPDLVGHNGCVALVNACLLPKKQQLTLERAAALPIRQAPETRNGRQHMTDTIVVFSATPRCNRDAADHAIAIGDAGAASSSMNRLRAISGRM